MGASNFLILSSIVFSIGLLGIFVNRKNMIIILMSIELMLLAVKYIILWVFHMFIRTFLDSFFQCLY